MSINIIVAVSNIPNNSQKSFLPIQSILVDMPKIEENAKLSLQNSFLLELALHPMREHSQLLHFPFKLSHSILVIFFLFHGLARTVVLHRRQILLLDFEAGFLPLLVDNVGDGRDGLIPDVFLSLHSSVVGHDLVEQALLVESLDGLHDLTFSVVTLLH